jgi:predicted DNA-binding transcriptional regulator YafY
MKRLMFGSVALRVLHDAHIPALSRCVSLEGIVLRQPLKKSHILMDWQVVKFLTRLQYAKAEQQCSRSDKLEMIRSAIEGKKNLEILYLKAKDEKSRRTIRPLLMGAIEYKGHPFTGLTAFCLTRREKRVFNVDRILEICESSS